MKKYIFTVAVIMAVAMPAGSSMASGTQTVAVSANVTGVCQFLSGGSISFTLDPSVGGNVNGTVTQPTFWCTNGTSYTITDDSGVNELVAGSPRMVSGTSATDFIPYSLTYTAAGAGTGRTSVITMDIASTVVAADYLDALVGAYSDTVTLTINPQRTIVLQAGKTPGLEIIMSSGTEAKQYDESGRFPQRGER